MGQIMESWIIVGQIMGVMDYSGADNGFRDKVCRVMDYSGADNGSHGL